VNSVGYGSLRAKWSNSIHLHRCPPVEHDRIEASAVTVRYDLLDEGSCGVRVTRHVRAAARGRSVRRRAVSSKTSRGHRRQAATRPPEVQCARGTSGSRAIRARGARGGRRDRDRLRRARLRAPARGAAPASPCPTGATHFGTVHSRPDRRTKCRSCCNCFTSAIVEIVVDAWNAVRIVVTNRDVYSRVVPPCGAIRQ
jgi:hypothetical protein